MSLDLIVVNYHTPLDLEAFLRSLHAHEPAVDCALTIVDVASEVHDDIYPWGRNGRKGRHVGVVDNIGYARACNAAAARGTSDVIALFNADTQLRDGSLDCCHDELMAHDDWGVLGPRQVDSNGRLRHAGIFGTNAKPVHRGWAEKDHGQYDDVRQAVTVSGSAYFVKRHVWEELTACPLFRQVAPQAEGAFLPTAHYYEETWCSYHAKAHGYEVVYFGLASIVHEWHRSSPVGGWAEQQLATSQAYFRAACDHHRIAHD